MGSHGKAGGWARLPEEDGDGDSDAELVQREKGNLAGGQRPARSLEPAGSTRDGGEVSVRRRAQVVAAARVAGAGLGGSRFWMGKIRIGVG